MTKAELIKMLQDSPAPDETNMYVYGDYADGQLRVAGFKGLSIIPIVNGPFRNYTPHSVEFMGKGLLITPIDD